MRRGIWQRRRTPLLLSVAVLATGLGLAAYASHLLRRTELQTVDARFSIRGSRHPPANVVVVQIDDVTFSQLQQRWPFPRRLHAAAIDGLRRAGARVIAYDVQFTEPTDARDDNALIAAVGHAGHVVLATTEVGAHGRTNVLGGDALLHQLGAHVGNTSVVPDSDGVFRRVRYSVDGLKTFPVVIAETASGRRVSRSDFGGGSVSIDYAGPPGTVRTVSFSQLLRGKVPPRLFENKVVIVGPSAPTLQDVHPTSTARDRLMSGAEVQANAAATVMGGVALRDAPGWIDGLLIAILGAGAPLASLRLGSVRSLLVALGLGVVFAVGAQLAFDAGRIVSFAYPLLALALATVGTLAVNYLLEAFERQRVRDMFSRFVPDSVVDEVLARTDDNLRLGAVERDCTVMFCDLRGFTSFSETQPAERVIEVVNFYLNEMSEAILDAGGTLVAYMGDGIMAVFGAPLEQADHADRALAAAREMVGRRLERFNAWLEEQGLKSGFRMGIGLNSGPVMAGNVGSEQRVEYAAIGDTTNTASRVESLTKGTPHMLFITASTRDRLQRPPPDLAFVDEFEVRGRTARLSVWSLAGERTPAQ